MLSYEDLADLLIKNFEGEIEDHVRPLVIESIREYGFEEVYDIFDEDNAPSERLDSAKKFNKFVTIFMRRKKLEYCERN